MVAPNVFTSHVTRVVLIVVAGDPVRAVKVTEELFPAALIDLVTFAELKYQSRVTALRRLRRNQAQALVLCYETIELLDERPLHELAARAMGASQLVLVDPSGRTKQCSLSRPPLRIALRLAGEAIFGAMLLASVNMTLPLLGRRRHRDGVHWRGRSGGPSNGPVDVAYVRSLGQPTVSNVGGTASHTVGIVRALADLGHDVQVISRPPAPDFEDPRVTVTIVPYRSTFFRIHPLSDLENHLRFLWRSRRLLSRARPTLLYQRHTRFDPSGAVLALLLDCPLVLEHEGSEELMAESADPTPCLRTLRVCERFSHRVASVVVAVSDEVRTDLVQHRGVPARKVIVNPSGVDASRFAPRSGGAERRSSLGIAPDTTVVGFSGTFGPWHGTDILVDAILRLSTDDDFCFLFIGDGEGRAAAELQLAEADHNRIFVGLVSLGEMPSYLDACDILVCPTTPMPGHTDFFGSPTKLFEYMAAEKAVVASNLGQMTEVIRNEENGLLVPPGDSTALADAIVRLTRDVELRTRLARAAREDVLRSYSWAKNATAIIEYFQANSRQAGETRPSYPESRVTST
jgi:glycosyltransferase involved in cell wall biosynthesis